MLLKITDIEVMSVYGLEVKTQNSLKEISNLEKTNLTRVFANQIKTGIDGENDSCHVRSRAFNSKST